MPEVLATFTRFDYLFKRSFSDCRAIRRTADGAGANASRAGRQYATTHFDWHKIVQVRKVLLASKIAKDRMS